mmetsp:Transcript_29395/g.44425  ORF Transcript_29395/g.44425 Transcript_29395/m.44425 type:complete len:116 (+) Transcript_29395:525-872(+)
MDDSNHGDSQAASDSIIGQFGVGFYSSFIVADHVDVYSKAGPNTQGVCWSSDGSGEYEIANVDDTGFERGTKIVLRLKKDCLQFCREAEVEKIIKKYSIFNQYPINLNGFVVNNL